MVATVTAVTAIALGAAFSAVGVVFVRAQRRDLDERLVHVARVEARELPRHGYSFSAGPGPAESDVGPMLMGGILYDAEGRVAATTAPFDRAAPTASEIGDHADGTCFDWYFQRRHYRGVFQPVAGRAKARMLLAESREALDGDEWFLVRAMLMAFLLALAWAAAVAGWRAGALVREQHAMAQMVRRFAQGDHAARVSLRAGDHETARLATDINDMADRVAALVSTQRRFVANAAHELRSPLTRLYGELQLAVRKERSAPEYKEAIVHALLATRRLTALAEDLLVSARPAGEGAPWVPVQIADAARSAIELILPEERARVEAHGDDSAVRGRPADLARMLRNLVENALAYARAGSTVHVGWAEDGGTVTVLVQDEGEEIPVSVRARIFEPFVRASRAGSGTGLGLGIARDIARAHGGDVTLESADGGATFAVTLPAEKSVTHS